MTDHPFTPSEEHPDVCTICGSSDWKTHYWKCSEHGVMGNGVYNCFKCEIV